MKTCPSCRTQLSEEASFCSQCGRNVAAGAASTQAAPPFYAYVAPGYGTAMAPYVYYPRKSVAAAIVLTIFFGPLGMFYSTVEGALIMCAVTFFAMFTGIGLLIAWPACVIWGAMAAENYNQRMMYWSGMRAGYPVV